MRAPSSLVGLTAALLIALACGGEPLQRVREATYPRDFHYITKQEIQTTMGLLAAQVDLLDQIMQQENGPQPEDRVQVAGILSRMQSLAMDLKRREHSNHPRIDDHAHQLQRNIERALVSVATEPPNYYYAGLVSAGCGDCHTPPDRRAPSPGAASHETPYRP